MLLDTLLARIVALGKIEVVSKNEQGSLSRDLLSFVMLGRTESVENEDHFFPPSLDVRVVNKLLAVLSPANLRVSVLFYDAFLPWAFDDETNQFQGGMKKKQLEAKHDAVEDFLSNPANDIWAWVAEHVKVEKKLPDYLKNFEKALKDGLKEGIEPDLFLHTLQRVLDVVVEEDNAEEVEDQLPAQLQAG